MDVDTKKLRLAEKLKLISMNKQSSEESQLLSNLLEQPLLTTNVNDKLDDAKGNLILDKYRGVKQLSTNNVLANIIKLIACNMPYGLTVSTFIEVYNINYNMCPALDISQFGVKNITYLMKDLSRLLPIHCRTIEGIYRVFTDCRYNVTYLEKNDLTHGFIDKTFVCKHFRDKIVYPGEYIVNLSFPMDVNLGITNSVEVRVSLIKDPLNIWIQFIEDNFPAVLNQLLEELKCYNQIDLEKWRIPQQFCCIGLPVVVFCQSTMCWQRARIIEIHAFTVTILFVDIGGTTTPSINNIYLMKRKFLTLPAQALHVGIFGVKHLVEEILKRPVKLLIELRYNLYIKMSSEAIRCRFTQKLCIDYFYVHFFDKNSISLDLDVFINEFLLNTISPKNDFHVR